MTRSARRTAAALIAVLLLAAPTPAIARCERPCVRIVWVKVSGVAPCRQGCTVSVTVIAKVQAR